MVIFSHFLITRLCISWRWRHWLYNACFCVCVCGDYMHLHTHAFCVLIFLPSSHHHLHQPASTPTHQLSPCIQTLIHLHTHTHPTHTQTCFPHSLPDTPTPIYPNSTNFQTYPTPPLYAYCCTHANNYHCIIAEYVSTTTCMSFYVQAKKVKHA